MEKKIDKKMDRLRKKMVFDTESFSLEHPIPNKKLHKLLDLETDCMPIVGAQEEDDVYRRTNHPDRQSTYVLIAQHTHPDFAPASYLAMTYFDRYWSRQTQPLEDPFEWKIFAVSCMLLALKMTTSAFPVNDYVHMIDSRLDKAQIRRAEFEILSVLKWNLRSITPACFLDLFIASLGPLTRTQASALKTKASWSIGNWIADTEYTQFKPSFIAASSLLEASTETLPGLFIQTGCSLGLHLCMDGEMLGVHHRLLADRLELDPHTSDGQPPQAEDDGKDAEPSTSYDGPSTKGNKLKRKRGGRGDDGMGAEPSTSNDGPNTGKQTEAEERRKKRVIMKMT